MEKTKPKNTTKAHIHQLKEMYNTKKHTKKLQPGLVASYDIWPGNGLVLARHKFVTCLQYLLMHSPTYLQPPTYMEQLNLTQQMKQHTERNHNTKKCLKLSQICFLCTTSNTATHWAYSYSRAVSTGHFSN